MPRFSANLGFLWSELPLLERIAAAGRAGFRAVELHWPYEQAGAVAVRDACMEAGVCLLGINSPFGDGAAGEFGLAALRGREADFERSLDQAIEYAARAGAGAIHVVAAMTAPQDRPRARTVFARNLERAARRAADFTLLLEPLNARDKPGYFYERTDDALSLIEEVGAPNLKLMFDAYHVGVVEGDVSSRLRACLPHIGHVQIAAVPSRAEPDEGDVDFRTFLGMLDAVGYSGWVGCEYRPRASTEQGLGWVERLGFHL